MGTSGHYALVSKYPGGVETARMEGRRKMDQALQHMPILQELREQFGSEQPLTDEVIGMTMYVEVKTTDLVELLALDGAEVAIIDCNPLSIHDDVSAALDANDGITSYTVHDIDERGYYAAINTVIAHELVVTIDDNMDMVLTICEEYFELIETIVGRTEGITTGVHRLRVTDEDDELNYPVFAVSDAPIKRLSDNVHGADESPLATIAMTTDLSYAGKNAVVGSYGYCDEGVAKRASGRSANVIVTKVDPWRTLEAHMEGYDVMPMEEAAKIGDASTTIIGNRDVIARENFENVKDDVLPANIGHFDIEIDLDALSDFAVDEYETRGGADAYELEDGRRLNVLVENHPVNLASPVVLGHPVEVMDQPFGMQTVVARELIENSDDYDAGAHDAPDGLDHEVTEIKLDVGGIEFDSMTDEQRKHMSNWVRGT